MIQLSNKYYYVQSSIDIVLKAMHDINPYAVVSMISGGRDSLCAYLVAKEIGVPITHIMHGVTRTGIPDTTDFVRSFAAAEEVVYIEADAGDRYENYVRRKGFFGKGVGAHTFSYHRLKKEVFNSTISRNIRHAKPGRPIMLLNGARMNETLNRSSHMKDPIKVDDRNNWWVNIIHYWSKQERDEYLDRVSAPANPVTDRLCRSGECMCGTMQSQASREEAAFYYPEWGKWLDELEIDVRDKFGFGWGESMPKQSGITNDLPSFQPMCVGCIKDAEEQDK